MSLILQARNVSKTYDNGAKKALTNFNLDMPEGCIYGLLGPNGAGKTTFIRCVNQIIAPDSGQIEILGEPLAKHHISQIGYMPEERGLYKNMTVGDQLVYLAALKGMSSADAKKEAVMWFERLHIEQWWKKKLSELSKGMAQKIQFVVTVLHKPKLLILDEPFSGFDPVNANLIRDEILALRDSGCSIILSTHRMESVEELCDRVALVNESEKIIDGKVYDVRQQMKNNSYTCELIDIPVNELDSKIQSIKLSFPEAEVGYNKHENGLIIQIPSHYGQKLILDTLVSTGTIQHFSENIPSMNDVFIRAVQQKNTVS